MWIYLTRATVRQYSNLHLRKASQVLADEGKEEREEPFVTVVPGINRMWC